MDEYTGLAKWGLLWVLAGVVLWGLLKASARTSNAPSPVREEREVEHEQGMPGLFEGLAFPGQPIIAHAIETLKTTFEAVGPRHPTGEQPAFYIYLTALVEEAYRQTFRDDLGLNSGNHEAFTNSLFGAADQDYARRFGPWQPEDEDDLSEDFFDAVASASLDVDGMWFDYAEERDRGGADGAWTRMLRRQHMSEYADELDEEAAGLVAGRIATLRQQDEPLEQGVSPSHGAY